MMMLRTGRTNVLVLKDVLFSTAQQNGLFEGRRDLLFEKDHRNGRTTVTDGQGTAKAFTTSHPPSLSPMMPAGA